NEGHHLAHVRLAIHVRLDAEHRRDPADCPAHHWRDVPAGRGETERFRGRLRFIEHHDDHITGFVHGEHTGEARDVDGLTIVPVDQLLCCAGLPSDAVARRVRPLARALHDDEPEERAHLVARLLAEDALARRKRMAGTDLEQGRRMIDAAVEQGRIAHRQMYWSDRDSLAETD